MEKLKQEEEKKIAALTREKKDKLDNRTIMAADILAASGTADEPNVNDDNENDDDEHEKSVDVIRKVVAATIADEDANDMR